MRIQMPMTTAVLCATLLITLSMAAWTQAAPPPESQQSLPSKAPGDLGPEAELLSKMHMANQMEIKAGQLAEAKGTTAAIRRFGQLLARDHSYADKRISDLAKQQGIGLTQPMPKSPEEQQQMQMQQQMMGDLENSQGPDFDGKFIQFNIKAHHMAVNMVSMGSNQLKPSPVKDLSGKMVPILKQHQEIAQRLEQRERASR